MASNENPLGAGAAALRALRELPPAAVSHYPDGGGETLRRAIGERLAVSPECVIVGNGSNEVLELAAQLVLTENDAAVFSAYSFAVYGLAVAARRARAIVAPARDYEHDLDALAAAAAKPDVRLLFVANPNNPTGGWHSPDKIRGNDSARAAACAGRFGRGISRIYGRRRPNNGVRISECAGHPHFSKYTVLPDYESDSALQMRKLSRC